MKRDYVDGVNENIDFFVGKEVEKTKTTFFSNWFIGCILLFHYGTKSIYIDFTQWRDNGVFLRLFNDWVSTRNIYTVNL